MQHHHECVLPRVAASGPDSARSDLAGARSDPTGCEGMMPVSWERWTVAGTSSTRRSPMIAGPATAAAIVAGSGAAKLADPAAAVARSPAPREGRLRFLRQARPRLARIGPLSTHPARPGPIWRDPAPAGPLSIHPARPSPAPAGPLSIHLFTISEQHGGRDVVAVLLDCHADPDARSASFDLPDAAPAEPAAERQGGPNRCFGPSSVYVPPVRPPRRLSRTAAPEGRAALPGVV